MMLDQFQSDEMDALIRAAITGQEQAGRLHIMAAQVGGGIAGGAQALRDIRDSNKIMLVDRVMIGMWILERGEG
jgi:hypothetical protein